MAPTIAPSTAALVVAISAVVASAAQVAWSWSSLRGLVRWSSALGDAKDAARTVLRKFLPVMLGLGTLQLNTMLDTVIAMWPKWIGPTMFGGPVPLDGDSNAILSYTQTLYQFPLGVFGIAVATAAFPLLARTAHDPEAFAATMRRGLRLSLFIALPATLGLLLVRHDLVVSIFGGPGGFSASGLDRSAAVLAGFSLGVWAYSLNHVLTRAFYAKGDTLTPMKVAIAMVLLNLTLNLTLIWYFREAGLAYATAIAATVQVAALAILARTRLRVAPIDAATAGGFARTIACTAIMAGAVLALHALASRSGASTWALAPDGTLHEGRGWILAVARLAASVLVGALAYIIAARLLRAPELRWLFERHRGAGGAGGADGAGGAGGASFDA